MVRQVICLHFGQAGLRTGCAFWDLLLAEQCLTYEGRPGIPLKRLTWGQHSDHMNFMNTKEGKDDVPPSEDCFFSETEKGKKVPRCAMLDLDSECQSEITRSSLGLLFSPSSFVGGKEDGSCLFPRGRRLASTDPIRGLAEEALRIQLEATDMPAGVLCMRSLGGGAGSGFGEELLSLLSVEAPKVSVLENLLWPATYCPSYPGGQTASRLASQSASCLEPYNALLSVDGIIERGGGALLMDNAALSGLIRSTVASVHPFIADINQVIAQALASKYHTTLDWCVSPFEMYSITEVPTVPVWIPRFDRHINGISCRAP
ncbi:tubulin alpha chain-like [Cyclospora cayetanensis]|uniref:Tubulin alpha chain-like n=1 Tax=Cyclospora cayetanensis TaxID=88456 RepID=A0A6P6S3Z0_9EIME|nr:tubulin alpha chain-like [Cyclospora cayetanensis]